MNSKLSLAEQLVMSNYSKTREADVIKKQFDNNKDKNIISETINNPLYNEKPSTKSENISCDVQNKSCKEAVASTQVKTQVGKTDEITRQQRNEKSELPLEKQKNKCRRGGRNKNGKRAAKFKPLLMSFDCPKFTQNAFSADNAPEKIDNKTDGFSLLPLEMYFKKLVNEEEFSFLEQKLQETRCEDPKPFMDLKQAKIYKIKCNVESGDSDYKLGNCMLFHGTSRENSRKILEVGYKNSAGGYFGRGVYMTESIDYAAHYSIRKTNSKILLTPNCVKKNMSFYIFVNEVAEPRSLKVEKYESYCSLSNNNYVFPKHPFCKYINKLSPERKIEIDDEGRFNSDEKMPGLSLLDEYVADCSLVKPRFLIKIDSSGFNNEKYSSFMKFKINKNLL